MTEKELTLVQSNSLDRDMYVQNVRERVKRLYVLEDEVAMLRKMNIALLEYFLRGASIPQEILQEFLNYSSSVERIKSTAKEELGL